MYKVLIVDDEPVNYPLFEKLADWKSKGFEIAGYAQDGQEALSRYEEISPDLIFMDIQLPLLDGLECVRAIREADTRTKIVIVSAYDKFSYAQRAIRYGVQDYLLKPLSRLLLGQLLDRMKKELDEREATEKAPSPFDTPLAGFLATYLDGGEIPTGMYPLLGLTVSGPDGKFLLGEERRAFLESLLKTLPETFPPCHVGLGKRGKACLALEGSFPEGGSHLANQALSLGEEKGLYVCAYPCLTRPEEWLSLFREADSYGFWEGSGTFILQKNHFSHAYAPLDPEGKQILMAIQKGTPLLLQEALDAFLSSSQKANLDPALMREVLFDFLLRLKYYLGRFAREDSFAVLRGIRQEHMEDFVRAEPLRNWVLSQVEAAFTGLEESLSSPGKKLVLKTNAFVETCFGNSAFSVQDAADYNGISKNYFTSLYKEQAGIGFWDYVTGRRMEKAKELLLSTDDLISSIASQVGYESEFHFSRKFKELFGVSPSQFRKKKGKDE